MRPRPNASPAHAESWNGAAQYARKAAFNSIAKASPDCCRGRLVVPQLSENPLRGVQHLLVREAVKSDSSKASRPLPPVVLLRDLSSRPGTVVVQLVAFRGASMTRLSTKHTCTTSMSIPPTVLWR